MAAQTLKKLIQHQAYRIVFLQLAGVVVLASLALMIRGITSGFSVLMGGLAYVIPNLIFVWRVFRFVGAQQMTLFVAAFFVGEAMKLFLSAILFLVIVKYLPVSLLSELVGFIGAMVSFWVVCLWHFSRDRSVKEWRDE
jgi:ATP synthase protein I